MSLYDAHCHLQDRRILPFAAEIVAANRAQGVREMVVNGTSEADWQAVADLAGRFSCVRPSFGLHPWQVNSARSGWQERLQHLWDEHAGSAVGEIGLDRWVEGFDMALQEPAFLWQLQQARERSLPVTIHCLRAWGRLYDLLREKGSPDRGFLLHSYAGPIEMVAPLASLGAYFSVSAYFFHERKGKQREAFGSVPLDRLLIETDAPDMLGPEELNPYSIDGYDAVNNPANIAAVYRSAAQLRDVQESELEERVAENYERFFGEGQGRV